VNIETTETAMMTRKEFREYLNTLYPAKPGMTSDPGYRKGERGSFGPTKRDYGDYLYKQDRELFEISYQDHIRQAGQ
jgi:hypothetical protein